MAFDDDVKKAILRYRGRILIDTGKDKRFGPAVNELLREVLVQKGHLQKPE